MITASQLKKIMPNCKKVAEYIEPLNAACAEFEINTPARLAAFTAQLAHESGELRWWKELWGPTPAQRGYEGRRDLGNIRPGDGSLFRGRGPIQITGRANYSIYGAKLGLDLIHHPELLEQPQHGFRSAACYWENHGLNELADEQTMLSFIKTTKRINGGTVGLSERLKYWNKAKAVLGAS